MDRRHGLTEILAEQRRGLETLYGERLARVVLFGSRARGEGRAEPSQISTCWSFSKGGWIPTRRSSERVMLSPVCPCDSM